MGKNSLIKSTSKKKKTKKEVEEKPEKKASLKTKAASKPKTTKTATKTTKKAAPNKKQTTKSKTSTKAKATKKVPTKKITYKDLIFKKFETRQPEKVMAKPVDKEKFKHYTAPPFVTGNDENENLRIKELLFRKYDWESVKAAAEKAASERTAAEKAATEKIKPTQPLKQIEPEQKANISYAQPKTKAPGNRQGTMLRIALVVFVLLIISLIGASYLNHGTYYLEQKNGAVEVWQGKFSPLGKTFLFALPGTQLPDLMKNTGNKEVIFPFVVNYYLDKADAFLDAPGVPDFIGIEELLNKSMPYAVSPELKKDIDLRLTAINFMALLYKAEVAANNDTPEGLENALVLLEEARALPLDEMQENLVNQKIDSIGSLLATFEPGVPETLLVPEPQEILTEEPIH